jgi:GntR family transcriptional regulator / MocR family aminotransferase
MSIEWTGLGPELLLRLDRTQGGPLRAQLERELRDAIRTGRLQAHERLPSSRVLAGELGLSRGLVLECYRQLQAEGYLTTRGGSATRVASNAGQTAAAPTARERPTVPRLDVDFMPGVPDLANFPRSDWAWALRESCRGATALELGYGDPRGTVRLRHVLAAYLGRVRNAAVAADGVIVCAGFAQALNLILRALTRDGVREVAVEDPGDLTYLTTVIRRLGLTPVPVPVDERGIDVAKLSATGARAAILTPAHQSPTGVVLAPERRQALLDWARERNGTVIEDDYDAEFRYDREPVGCLQGLAPDHVASAGSVSKSLAPALRIGWIACPPALVEAVTEEKRLDDRGSPTLEQLALAQLIESGRYDRHLRRMRAVYAARRDTLVRSLAHHAPAVELHGLAAGFHAVAHLPAGVEEAAAIAGARDRSVGLHGMSVCRSSGASQPSQLVLGFGNLSEPAIERGVSRIADLLQC